MAGVLAPVARQQYFDDEGAPLAGGFLYVFEAGTDTPAPTYSDIDLEEGHEQAHPVELDAAGRTVMYLEPDTSYKFVLKNADEEEIWTQDEIPSGPASA